jgi:1-deoxy-D-xylulose-5-phosphate reductoisomerase
MRTPIQYALTWPQHVDGPVPTPDFAALGRLDFEVPDRRRFPFVDMGYQAARDGGLAPVVMNAANEVAVQRFLDGDIGFVDIFAEVQEALAALVNRSDPSLEEILAVDAEVRQRHAGTA